MFKSVVLVVLLAVSPQPVQTPKGTDAPKGVSAQRGRRSNPSAGNQQPTPPPTPPINITVTAAQKSPPELEADRRDRDREIGIQGKVSTFTGFLVGVGVLQIFVLVFQAVIYWRQLHTTRAVERAYVILSHETRKWVEGDENRRAFDVRGDPSSERLEMVFAFQVQNEGRTPTDVLGGGLWMHHLPDAFPQSKPIPMVPATQPVHVDPAFLVPRGLTFAETLIFLDAETWARVQDGSEHLWLIGYVDYRDRFGKRHRGGYGRHYNRHTGYLDFDETTGALNYDRPLTYQERQRYRANVRG